MSAHLVATERKSPGSLESVFNLFTSSFTQFLFGFLFSISFPSHLLAFLSNLAFLDQRVPPSHNMADAPSPGASCPDGGSFYICEKNATEFVGCCIMDPCADDSGKCAHDDLRPAAFWSESHDEIPKQECSSRSKEAKWYICANDKNNFMGCCDHANPCIAGSCQPGYFAPARLSSNLSHHRAYRRHHHQRRSGRSRRTPYRYRCGDRPFFYNHRHCHTCIPGL